MGTKNANYKVINGENWEKSRYIETLEHNKHIYSTENTLKGS